jgi:hypothetical protein
MNNVGRAIARQLWWAIAHPTSFMLNFRLFTTPLALDVGRLDLIKQRLKNRITNI